MLERRYVVHGRIVSTLCSFSLSKIIYPFYLYTPVQQKMKSTEEEVGKLKEKCAYSKGQVDLLEKQVQEVRNKVEKQNAELAKLWEQIDGVNFPFPYLFFFCLQKNIARTCLLYFDAHPYTLLLFW